MKKLIIIIILAIGFIGCEKEEDNGCSCDKNHYTIETTIVFDGNGIPHTEISHVFQYTEAVTCQEEVHQQPTGDYTYFNIECD